MGEIAEMHLDGTLCEMCGVYLDGNTTGYPRYCSIDCAKDRGADFSQVINEYTNEKFDVETIENHIDSAICWLEIIIEEIKKSKTFKKNSVKEISSIIKKLEFFKKNISLI